MSLPDASNPIISKFNEDLQTYNDDDLIKKLYRLNMQPVCMSNDRYFNLKNLVSTKFGLDMTDVFMVGSGKLGFTIKPNEQYRLFSDKSDIDLAIVSNELFEQIWKSLFLYKEEIKYWPKEMKFKEYLFKGWIRPDYLPPSKLFQDGENWWNFFQELTSSGDYGPYRIRAGLYHSHFFFESYQKQCIQLCRKLIGEAVPV